MRWFFNFASVGREALLDDRFAPEAVIRRPNVIEYSLAARQLMAQQHRAILYQLPAR